jgi:DNA-binding Lrp family transcriptional regulator
MIAAKLEEIMEYYHMASDMDFLLRVTIGNMEEYNNVLVKKLGNLAEYKEIQKLFRVIGS